MKFRELMLRVNEKYGKRPFLDSLLALDPGETTGWALFSDGKLEICGQISSSGTQGLVDVTNFVMEVQPRLVICEGYKVYDWKRDQHVWSDLYTVRLIGAIEVTCAKMCIPVRFQMAQTGKSFCSDAKLKAWGYWQVGERHARDAIRHGCHWLLFGKETLDG